MRVRSSYAQQGSSFEWVGLKQSRVNKEWCALLRTHAFFFILLWLYKIVMEDQATELPTEPAPSSSTNSEEISIEEKKARSYVKLSRENSVGEKRGMRQKRKRRMRLQKRTKGKKRFQHLQSEVEKERLQRVDAEKKVVLYRNMSRSYWERWNWELQKRKESLALNSKIKGPSQSSQQSSSGFHEIDPTMLKDPTFVKADEDLWIGRGSFGVVKIQLYRGIKVVCKELRVKTLLQDVHSEASILMRLSHPYLPYLFGVCTTAEPYRLVMQFHGIGTYSCTFSSMMQQDSSLGGKAWLSLCGQVFEAFRYLHDEASVLHNDVKANNLLIAESISTEPDEDLGIDKARVQAVVIDFGMASNIQDKKRLRLSENEMVEYRRKHPHIAPEVVEGDHHLSIYSDVFSLGSILHKCLDNACFDDLPNAKTTIAILASKCHCVEFKKRPRAFQVLNELQDIVLP